MTKRVLIVTTAFSPANTPDMQRARMSLPHYFESGWEPIVLTVDPKEIEAPREPELVDTLPSNVTIHRCGALPLYLLRWFGIRNLGLRAWWHLFFTGWRIIRRKKIDLIFLTNTQFATFTLGRFWRFFCGVPYVIDLQDPWVSNYYKGPRRKDRPGGWKYDIAQMQARLLEGWSLRRASGLISVSPSYIEDLNRRHPWFSRMPTDVIGFGASEADLAKAGGISRQPLRSRKPVRVVSTGAAGSIMQPALQILFDSLATMQPKPTPDSFRLEFVGTSYAPEGKPSVVPLARNAGVDELVSEQTARLGLIEALKTQVNAHALLLLGSSDPSYSASKLYLYFLSQRPVLAIVLKGSVLERQLRELSFATVVSFDQAGPTAETRGQIQYFIQDALAGFPSGAAPHRNEQLFRQSYLAPALTARQCAFFTRVCSTDKN